jgi:poly-gamma-glutamate capsule biosynthesis protein CapA/YwtB (metallophosphatase superfamily)
MWRYNENNMSIKIGLAGDVMIGRLVDEYLTWAKSDSLWGNMLPLMRSTDFNLVNLEAALTTHDKAVPKVFNFKSHPKHVKSLVEANIKVVNLANNHVLDYDREGLLETLKTLDRAGIQHVGAGKNIEEAQRPITIECKGVRIGFLGATDNEPTWAATSSHPGVFYLEIGDIDALLEKVRQLKATVDYLILSIHWGPNMQERPSSRFRKFAHQLLDCGVDLIHGHSAHIFQGMENYGHGMILYDTGDFVDDYYVDPHLRNDLSFFFIAEVSKRGLRSLRLIPVEISNFQVHRASNEMARQIIERMRLLSSEWHTPLKVKNEELIYEVKDDSAL